MISELKERALLKNITNYLSKVRNTNFITKDMSLGYIGEETGNGWCRPDAVKYLSHDELLEYPEAFSDPQYKNKKFEPTFFKSPNCHEKPEFPKEFQSILPLQKGNEFRDWNEFPDERESQSFIRK